MKQPLIIISFSDLRHDSRVRRHIFFLKDRYKVTACGFTNPAIDGVEFIPLNYRGPKNFITKVIFALLLKFKQYEKVYWSEYLVKEVLKTLLNQRYALILANELETLPVAISLANSCQAKVIFDAHEYAPKEYDDQWTFRFFLEDYYYYLCSKYLPKTDAMLTVSPGIAEAYEKVFGVPCSVLSNAPFYEDQVPRPTDNKEIRLVYHGGADKSRRIENFINLMKMLDKRFTLDLILMGNESYIRNLMHIVGPNSRINFRTPVPSFEICKILREYDIGIHLLSEGSFNARFALPNKLFEFIQGRLCVAIWPSVEMAKIVRKYNCGVVSQDFTIKSMAKELNSLEADDIQFLKEQSHKAAEELCAERNQHILLDLVKNLIG